MLLILSFAEASNASKPIFRSGMAAPFAWDVGRGGLEGALRLGALEIGEVDQWGAMRSIDLLLDKFFACSIG